MTVQRPDAPAARESWIDLLGDVPIRFGLREQGHFEYVDQAVRAGVSWEDIGAEIGWKPAAAQEYYETEKSDGD